MFRIVPQDEVEFNKEFERCVYNFCTDKGLASNVVRDSILIRNCIKNNVTPSETDKMNTKEERAKWEKMIKEDESNDNTET
jgi:hypothetical protein